MYERLGINFLIRKFTKQPSSYSISIILHYPKSRKSVIYLQSPDRQSWDVFRDIYKRWFLVHQGRLLRFNLNPGVPQFQVNMVGDGAEVRPRGGRSFTVVGFISLLTDECGTLDQTVRESRGGTGGGVTQPVQIRLPGSRARPGTCRT